MKPLTPTIDYYESLLEFDVERAQHDMREAQERLTVARRALETHRARKRPWWQQ